MNFPLNIAFCLWYVSEEDSKNDRNLSESHQMGPTRRRGSASISQEEPVVKREALEESFNNVEGTSHQNMYENETKIECILDNELDVELVEESNGQNLKSEIISRKEKGSKRKESASTPMRHYDRYKNQDYCKRNDGSKYCQICRKKVFGKLRSLPSEHRLRRVWILRFNLDAERSAELWVREAFSDATHCGEACPIHFPVGSHNLKNRQLLPIDMRQDPDSYSIQDDEVFDFDSLELECVFCQAKNVLRCMVPFTRTRSRRYKWVNAICGDGDSAIREVLQEKLKNGASKFLCDWHFSDNDFDINQFGEWRLRKDAVPDATLCEEDKQANRIYMINHGDTILSRNIDPVGRREDMMMFRREGFAKGRMDGFQYRYLSDKMRRSHNRRMYMYDRPEYSYVSNIQYDDDQIVEDIDGPSTSHMYLDNPRQLHGITGPEVEIAFSEEPEIQNADMYTPIEYSEDSDEELEALKAAEQYNGEQVHTAYFCQVCNRVMSSRKSMEEHKPRTWPFDEPKHEKWLEIMNWPSEFEESMRVLWLKRKNDFVKHGNYHFCPITICESHLAYRQLHQKMDEWVKTFCVLCDEDLKDPNLLLPFPNDRVLRRLWVHTLVSGPPINRLVERRWKWLKDRLTRAKSTRYRLCVYHFCQDAFVEKEDCVEFNEASIPLPLGLSEYDVTPRGPQGFIKCPLCDMWGPGDSLVEIRPPSTQAERILLVELLSGDKPMMKKGVEQLAMHPCRICKAHLPSVDPYSVIAERRLVAQIEVQCVQCNHRDVGANMVPFPAEPFEKRKAWIDSICRDHFFRQRLQSRLMNRGRHYLCTAHFHKNSLRYIPGLGIWKRFIYMPLAMSTGERDKIMGLQEGQDIYHPLVIAGLDDNGVVHDLTYDEVSELLGENMDPIFPPDYKPRALLSSNAKREEEVEIEGVVEIQDPLDAGHLVEEATVEP
ncbi:unnamed protein product [Auanema sp. JU1783]|nr:unnamed protein product [Auanema sp. JU1783]